MNMKKPPFDNPKVRLAVSYAIDRRGLIQAVHQGSANLGAGMAPRPTACGGWPKGPARAARLRQGGRHEGPGPPAAGRGEDHAADAAQGRDGHPGHRHLRRHGLVRRQRAEAGRHRGDAEAGGDGPVHPMATRGDYQIGANLTGLGPTIPTPTSTRTSRAARPATTADTATSRS